jgi:hypothetical protein
MNENVEGRVGFSAVLLGQLLGEAAELIERLQADLTIARCCEAGPFQAHIAKLQAQLDAETLKRRQVEHERDAILKTLADAMSYARHSEGCSAALGSQYRCRCGYREFAALQGEVDADRVDRGSHEA